LSIGELSRISGVAQSRRFTVPWPRIEDDLGTSLPADYKDIVEWFGPGEFSPFLGLFVPGIENPATELRAMAKSFTRSLGSILPIQPRVPYGVFPAPGGLLAWGSSENGGLFFWETSPEIPDSWRVVAVESGWRDIFIYDGGIGDFLVSLFEGRLEIPFIGALNEDIDEEFDEIEVLEFRPNDGTFPPAGRLEAIGRFED